MKTAIESASRLETSRGEFFVQLQNTLRRRAASATKIHTSALLGGILRAENEAATTAPLTVQLSMGD